MAANDTYEEYDTFIKDMYGSESELKYNRLLCEALLMSEEDMADEALAKFSECIECYFEKYNRVAVEPILYKLVLLIRLAAVKLSSEEGDSNL
jgi:hypothetical protein